MEIAIDLAAPLSLEEQIAAGIRHALAVGGVAPGDELPSVRQLAGDLGVHWNTVARAYRKLGEEGLLSVRRGRGAVASERPRTTAPLTRAALHAKFSEAVAAGVLSGLSLADISATFKEALAAYGGRGKR